MEDYFDRRQREKAEAREAEEKKKAREARRHAETIPVIQARAAGTQAAWVEYIDRRISQRMAEGTIPIPEDLLKAIGEEIGETRAKQRIETKAAIEKAKGELAATFSAQLKAMEERLATRSDKRIAEHAVQTTDRINQQWDAIAKERQEWRSEIKSVVDAAQRSFEGGINTHFAAMEQRVVHQTDGRINEHIAQTAELTSTLWNMIVTECSDRQKEIKAAVEEVQRAVETKQAAKLEALEQRSVQHTDQRITQHIEQCTERTRALRDVIATESWDRQKEIKAAGEEAHRAVETKLEALEQRLKAVPQASNRRIINGGSRSISASGTSSRKWADVSGPAHCTRPSARSQLSLRENLRHQINAAT
jgi:hypothetical protein